jgi:hypothetical protein
MPVRVRPCPRTAKDDYRYLSTSRGRICLIEPLGDRDPFGSLDLDHVARDAGNVTTPGETPGVRCSPGIEAVSL